MEALILPIHCELTLENYLEILTLLGRHDKERYTTSNKLNNSFEDYC